MRPWTADLGTRYVPVLASTRRQRSFPFSVPVRPVGARLVDLPVLRRPWIYAQVGFLPAWFASQASAAILSYRCNSSLTILVRSVPWEHPCVFLCTPPPFRFPGFKSKGSDRLDTKRWDRKGSIVSGICPNGGPIPVPSVSIEGWNGTKFGFIGTPSPREGVRRRTPLDARLRATTRPRHVPGDGKKRRTRRNAACGAYADPSTKKRRKRGRSGKMCEWPLREPGVGRTATRGTNAPIGRKIRRRWAEHEENDRT